MIDVVGLEVRDVRVTGLLLPVVRCDIIMIAVVMSVRSAVCVRIMLVCLILHSLALCLLPRLLGLSGGGLVIVGVVVLMMAVVGIMGYVARAGVRAAVEVRFARRHHDQDDGENHRGEDDPLSGVALKKVHEREPRETRTIM